MDPSWCLGLGILLKLYQYFAYIYTHIYIFWKGYLSQPRLITTFTCTLVRQSSPNCIFHLWEKGGFCISKISYSISDTTMTGNQFSCFLSECFWLSLSSGLSLLKSKAVLSIQLIHLFTHWIGFKKKVLKVY